MSTPPDRIDRAALERIIQRAAELQTGDREIGDQLSPDEVLALGRDVGIPDRYLRQAILEEQTRLPAASARTLLDQAVGPGEVAAQRVVRGGSEEVERRLLGWLEENELLTIQRQQPGRITWEPLRGMQVAFRRSAALLGGGKRLYMLEKAELVTAAMTPLEPGFCHVGLSATLRRARGAVVGGALGALTAGVGISTVLAVMSPFWWVAVAPLPMAAGLGWGVSRQFRPLVDRVTLGLERALDHLEQGAAKPEHALPQGRPGLLGMIADEVRRALMPPAGVS